jgi:hypothetical protein
MKKWYESKTVWVNVIALVAAVLQVAAGKEIIDAGTQGVILTVINLLLRTVTKHEINWKGDVE